MYIVICIANIIKPQSRVFYETLLSQRPTSEMAQEWCLAYGIMEEDKAKTAFKAMEKRKLKNQQKVKDEKKNSSSKSQAPGDTKTKKKKIYCCSNVLNYS